MATRAARQGPALKFGLLLPKTGALAFQGPPMFAAAKLAVKEINEAGGVLGQQVLVEEGDDGTNPDIARRTVERFDRLERPGDHRRRRLGVSKAVIPRVAQAGKVMISPSATSDELTKFDDKGLFFRTSPPDVLQAKAIADIIMRDGHTKVAIIARDDTMAAAWPRGPQRPRRGRHQAGQHAGPQVRGEGQLRPEGRRGELFTPIAGSGQDLRGDRDPAGGLRRVGVGD